MLIIVGVGLASADMNTTEDYIALVGMIASIIALSVFVIFLFKRKKKPDIHKMFKKLENRYNDLEKNLKEMNQQMDNPNTYAIRTGLYLTKDWIVSLNMYCLDYAKISDIVGVCHYADTLTTDAGAGMKTRTSVDRLIVLLNNAEILEFDASREASNEAAKAIALQNPYIVIGRHLTLDDGRRLDLLKDKSEIIEIYNQRNR